MISALAFGYGVGMAAPDSTISGVRAAVDSYRAAGPPAGAPGYGYPFPGPQGPGYGVPPGYGMPYPYAAGPYAPPHPYAGYGPTATATAPPRAGTDTPGGAESRELERLRSEHADGRSCNLSVPRLSEPPDNASTADGSADPEELDPAGLEALSRLQLPDFRVAISRGALKYVRFLTRSHRGRDMFESWLKRSGRYQDLIQQTLREWHLPEDLIWVAMIESGFDPRVTSPAGAVGLWQFMRSTGGVYGLQATRFVDDRRDPQLATRAAAHHLRDLYQRFGSWDLALAAYNMGYEQLLNAIDRYGTTEFNELARQRAIPSETANYVPKIIAAALVANNLERYGFSDIKVFQPLHSAELSVPGGTSLATIAKAAGVSTARLQKHNPQLLRNTLPQGGEYTVYVPATSLSRARAALPAMLDAPGRATDADVLAPSDLFGLGGGDRDRVSSWGEDENLLQLLPKPKRRSLRSVLSRPQEAADDEPLAEEFEGDRRSDREVVMYRVGPGETMIGVAKQFAVDIDDLARDNSLEPEDKLREGALLRLMVKRQVLDRWKRATGDAKHKAKPRRRASDGNQDPSEVASESG